MARRVFVPGKVSRVDRREWGRGLFGRGRDDGFDGFGGDDAVRRVAKWEKADHSASTGGDGSGVVAFARSWVESNAY